MLLSTRKEAFVSANVSLFSRHCELSGLLSVYKAEQLLDLCLLDAIVLQKASAFKVKAFLQNQSEEILEQFAKGSSRGAKMGKTEARRRRAVK